MKIENSKNQLSQDVPLTRGLLLLMAVTSSICVANLYYVQPLLADMAQEFQVTAAQIGKVPMLTQVGYALGLFLFIPLGDIKERKKLILTLLGIVTLALIAVALSENLLMLNIASFAVGLTSVVPQIIVPLTAQLANPAARGKAVGTVMSGLFLGILLARTVSGIIANLLGWRSIFWVAAVLMLLLALTLKLFLPSSKPVVSGISYRKLHSTLLTLIVEQPLLRKSSLLGAMVFGSFSAFWATLAFFLKEPPYEFSSDIIGLFGLLGIFGSFFAPMAGRLADQKSPRVVAGSAGIVTLIAFLIVWQLGYFIWGIILGVLVMDLGTRSTQIANQTQIYSLIPEARNRLNTVYMVSYFSGGATGSFLGTYAWGFLKWDGVFIVGSIMILIGMTSFLPHPRKKIDDSSLKESSKSI